MRIAIENLGPIKKAEIDLSRRMTIFCGPNNSGKTYTAFLIYALTKENLQIQGIKYENADILDLMKNRLLSIPIEVNDVWECRQLILKELKTGCDNLFGVSSDQAKKLFNNFNLDIIQTKDELQKSILGMDFEKSFEYYGNIINVIKKKNTKIIDLSHDEKLLSRKAFTAFSMFAQTSAYNFLISSYPFISSYILPVERNSIYTFSKELSIKKHDLLDQVQELANEKEINPLAWLRKRTTRYPLPIRDGLKIAEDLANHSKTKSEFYSFAEELENELLNGKVSVTNDGEVQFSPTKAKDKKIPIQLSASIVKTLSSLVFYLKHLAKKNDLIIIDEPELNLHPNNQVKLARIFAKLIHKGFRLLISTHSDYITREINNLIMLSADKEGIPELRSKYGYADDEILSKKDVGAYLFNYKDNDATAITVSEIEITESGFDVSTIDETIDQLNQTSEDLFYTLKYGKEDELVK